MAKYRVTKKIDFGPYTILGKSGLQSDQVPLNNYAPKIGDTIEGEIGSQVRHGITITGVIWPIATNGTASTTGQMSTQIIPMDSVEIVVTPTPTPPVDPNNPNPSPIHNPETPALVEENKCWACENKGKLIIGALLLIVAIILFSSQE